jgi:hypothetical protein
MHAKKKKGTHNIVLQQLFSLGKQSHNEFLVGSKVLIENRIQECDTECSDSWWKEVYSAATVQTVV